MTATPGLPDQALIVGDWTGEVASQQEREAAAYRDLRERMREVGLEFLRTRDLWANSPADGAVARAVAYQYVAGRVTRALAAVERAHQLGGA